MALKLSEPRWKIERVGYDNLVFSVSSNSCLVWPKAVEFAASRDMVLQNFFEAAAFRINAAGQDHVDKFQTTRTAVGYFKSGNDWFAAFDDIADAKKNIILALAQEGYLSNKNIGNWALPKQDAHVRGLLDRAEKSGRIMPIKGSPLELSLEESDGKSKFGITMRPVLQDVSEPYAEFLRKKGHVNGYFWPLKPAALEKLGIGDKVEVRTGGLGGIDYCIYGIHMIFTGSRLSDSGMARGSLISTQSMVTH